MLNYCTLQNGTWLRSAGTGSHKPLPEKSCFKNPLDYFHFPLPSGVTHTRCTEENIQDKFSTVALHLWGILIHQGILRNP